jgi:iron complex outermembrane receptor protein
VTIHSTSYRPVSVRSAVAAILGAGAMCALTMPAHAQDEQPAQQDPQLEEITITGSRIARKDFTATSPIVTIGTEVFEQSSTLAIEANLNKLPQFTPAVTQQVTQDVQNTATNTVGAATVSLRGLGPNRNLVLIDGRRAMPVNAQMVVDVNTIPSAAVERVEIITGGASSVYGADAVGGVVNFILKKNFSGIEFDTQWGSTELGDGEELRIAGLMGGNFADGRGNIMIGVEHSRRHGAAMLDRDFYRMRFSDPTVTGGEFFFSDTNYAPAGNNPNQAVVDDIFGFSGVAANTTFYVNTDGTLYTGPGGSSPAGAARYKGPLDGIYRKLQANGQIGQNQLDNLVSAPLTRYSIFGRGTFEITDHASFFVQGNFNTNETDSTLQFSPAANGWGVLIPYGNDIYAPSVDADGNTLPAYMEGGSLGLACPPVGGCTNSQAFPVPPELARLLDSRDNPNAPWQLNKVLDFLGPRSSSNDSDNFQIIVGFEGDFPNNNWTWEVYASHGEQTVQADLRGFGSLSRYRAIVTSPNYGRNFFVTGNSGAPGFGFAGAQVTCQSGIPVFGGGEVTPDCIDAIGANLQTSTKMEQNIVEANLQGKLADIPTGELLFALGTTWRENTFTYQTDILTSQNSFLDGGIGLFPAGDSSGSTEVKEIYGELLVPVLSDLPGVQALNLELGYRYSDYDTVGTNSTYKGIIDWAIASPLRFRGGYQLAIRAPNIGELFLARTQTVGSTSYGDYCSLQSNAPFGANPAFNPANAANVENLCRQLMGPTGAAVYYAGTQLPGGPGLSLPNTIGNPFLDPEEAETITLGFVFASPFENRFARQLRASIDWYSIDLTDAIGATAVDTVAEQCFSPQWNPTFDPNAEACRNIVRDPNTGGPGTINVSYTNAGAIRTQGIDLQVDWGLDLADFGAEGAGSLAFNFLFNYVNKYETRATPSSPFLDWTDSLGPPQPTLGLQSGVYKWKAYTTVNYFRGPISASLRWRYLPDIRAAGAVSTPETNTVLGAPSYSIVDLAGLWNITDSLQLRLGVDNLFDKDPPIINRNPAAPNGMTGGTLDPNAGNGPGGYWDVLGRRYYVGLKASF